MQVSCNVARPTKAVRRPDRAVCSSGPAVKLLRQGSQQAGRRGRGRRAQERPVHRGRQRLPDFGPHGVFGQRQGILGVAGAAPLRQKVINLKCSQF